MLRALQAANLCFARIYHRLDVRCPCRLPREGPAILVCNHTSGLDPVLLQSVCPRLIVWMMAREYYEQPGLRWFFEQVQAIPVDRGGRDLAATRRALRALSSGLVLGVFPEGRIEENCELLPFQTGVAMMAQRTKVRVYPAYLDGSQRRLPMLQAYLQPQHATIAFGPAIDLCGANSSQNHLEEATNVIQEAVKRLRQTTVPPKFEPNRNIFPLAE